MLVFSFLVRFFRNGTLKPIGFNCGIGCDFGISRGIKLGDFGDGGDNGDGLGLVNGETPGDLGLGENTDFGDGPNTDLADGLGLADKPLLPEKPDLDKPDLALISAEDVLALDDVIVLTDPERPPLFIEPELKADLLLLADNADLGDSILTEPNLAELEYTDLAYGDSRSCLVNTSGELTLNAFGATVFAPLRIFSDTGFLCVCFAVRNLNLFLLQFNRMIGTVFISLLGPIPCILVQFPKHSNNSCCLSVYCVC